MLNPNRTRGQQKLKLSIIKIFTSSLVILLIMTIEMLNFEEGRNKKSVKGRLKHSIEFWRNTLKANNFVIELLMMGINYR